MQLTNISNLFRSLGISPAPSNNGADILIRSREVNKHQDSFLSQPNEANRKILGDFISLLHAYHFKRPNGKLHGSYESLEDFFEKAKKSIPNKATAEKLSLKSNKISGLALLNLAEGEFLQPDGFVDGSMISNEKKGMSRNKTYLDPEAFRLDYYKEAGSPFRFSLIFNPTNRTIALRVYFQKPKLENAGSIDWDQVYPFGRQRHTDLYELDIEESHVVSGSHNSIEIQTFNGTRIPNVHDYFCFEENIAIDDPLFPPRLKQFLENIISLQKTNNTQLPISASNPPRSVLEAMHAKVTPVATAAI